MILMRHGESEFNVVYKKTRVDPGIRDPRLTDTGRRQVERAAEWLRDRGVQRIVTSPYTRALGSAAIVAERLGVPVTIDAAIGERAAFHCDIGSPVSDLRRDWPQFALDHIEEMWWPTLVETEEALDLRCRRFRDRVCALADWPGTLVVTHWGFIRALTGHTVDNAQLVAFDPTADHPGGGAVVGRDISC